MHLTEDIYATKENMREFTKNLISTENNAYLCSECQRHREMKAHRRYSVYRLLHHPMLYSALHSTAQKSQQRCQSLFDRLHQIPENPHKAGPIFEGVPLPESRDADPPFW